MSPVAPKNILRHELIGLRAKVARASHKRLVGLKGSVVDESKGTLTLSNGKTKRIIPKDVAVFHFHLPDGAIVEVQGSRLLGRPEDRVKARVRKW